MIVQIQVRVFGHYKLISLKAFGILHNISLNNSDHGPLMGEFLVVCIQIITDLF